MNRALAITEILQLIFDHCDDRSNAQNACVCQLWSNYSLISLWSYVSTPKQLFHPLGPLNNIASNRKPQYEFREPVIRQHYWIRFMRYAALIQHIKFKVVDAREWSQPFEQFQKYRPSADLFPNLQTLDWRSSLLDFSMRYCPMFMQPSVRTLRVQLKPPDRDNYSHSDLDYFTDYVKGRLSHLTRIEFGSSHALRPEPDADSHRSLAEMLSGLTELRTAIIGHDLFTEDVFHVLATLPHLRDLYTRQRDKVYDTYSDPTIGEGPLCFDAFHNLQDLRLSHAYAFGVQLLRKLPNCMRLKTLHVIGPNPENPTSMQALLTVIGDLCTNVEDVYLDSLCPANREDPYDDFAITMDTIQPILRCTKMKSLSLFHPNAPKVDPDEVLVIAKSFPNIRRLFINPDPAFQPTASSSITFSILTEIASSISTMRELGLYFNTSSAFFPTTLPHFPALKELNCGCSPLPEPEAVSFFLAKALPLDCHVSGYNGLDFFPEVSSGSGSDSEGKYSEIRQQWEDLDGRLPLLRRFRQMEVEERENAERGKSLTNGIEGAGKEAADDAQGATAAGGDGEALMARVKELEAEVERLKALVAGSRPQSSSSGQRKGGPEEGTTPTGSTNTQGSPSSSSDPVSSSS